MIIEIYRYVKSQIFESMFYGYFQGFVNHAFENFSKIYKRPLSTFKTNTNNESVSSATKNKLDIFTRYLIRIIA